MTTPLARSTIKAVAALLCTCLSTSAAWAATAYNVVSFNVPGSPSTQPSGINDSGSIVGSFAGGADGLTLTGFVYRDGVFSPVAGPAGAVNSAVRGIANSGLMVGNFGTATVGLTQQTFLFDGTNYTVFTLPFGEGAARSISPNGRYLAGDVFGNRAGFVYDLLTGQAQTFGTDSDVTVTQGVNDQGLVVGSRRPPPTGGTPEVRPFVFDALSGVYTENPGSYPGLTDARPRAINNNGVIGGFTVGVGGGAFILEAGQVTTLSFASASSSLVYGINSQGVAVGYATFGVGPGSFSQGFIATPVPEPASAALLLAGGVGLWALRRRRPHVPA